MVNSLLQRLCPMLLLLPFSSTFAQQPSGSIHLEVKDSSGAAVEASGLLEGQATGFRRSFHTDAQGVHTVEELALGKYRLRVSKGGFQSQSFTMTVDSATQVKQVVILAIGTSSYSVNVVSSTPLAGMERSLDEIPAPTQTATNRDIEANACFVWRK